MHGLRLTKAHLGFCRMHVHIHGARVEPEFEHKTGRRTAVHLVTQCVTDGVQNHLVAHPAAIYK